MKKSWMISVCAMMLLSVVAFSVHGCGAASTSGGAATSGTVSLPLITPPVKAVTPAGFGGGAVSHEQLTMKLLNSAVPHNLSLSASDIKSRFFSAGPTNIFNLLGLVDSMISAPQGVNGATGACITQTPIAYTITPFGETVTMYSQCARAQTSNYTGDPAFFQFGVKNNLIYLYSASGVGRAAAIISPLTASGTPLAVATEVVTASPSPIPSYSPNPSLSPIPSSYQVELWYGIGFGATPATGSYGVVHLIANTVTKSFEMTVAGQGFGYCGAQLKSDGTNIYATGSTDMGTTCNATDTLCVLASDGTTAGTCGSALTTFSLPPLGRVTSTGPNGNVLGVSMYPGGASNLISVTGLNTDSLWFGPLVITPGTGSL